MYNFLRKLYKKQEKEDSEENSDEAKEIENKIKTIEELLKNINLRNALMSKEKEKKEFEQLLDKISSDDDFKQFNVKCFEFFKICDSKNIKNISHLFKTPKEFLNMFLKDYHSLDELFRLIEKKYENSFESLEDYLKFFNEEEEEKNEINENSKKMLEIYKKFLDFRKENSFLSELEDDLKSYPIKCH